MTDLWPLRQSDKGPSLLNSQVPNNEWEKAFEYIFNPNTALQNQGKMSYLKDNYILICTLVYAV